ncbi:MAG: selenocysteine-specific translation elongation factor [Anaerolineae bacterium]
MTYVIGTAGHVDHGKSTLVEALTGIDPDRLEEEKAREMTIDLGFAWLTLPNGTSAGVIDVPGHRDFIENMLAGVGGIDMALLVVAADEGIMPQTREHLAILDLLEVQHAVVALTKVDLVEDAEWLDLVTLDIETLLESTALAGAPIVPVSARTGQGLGDLLAAVESVLSTRPPRPDMGKPRLPVDRVFTISGFGTVVTGTLSGGSLKIGDEVEIVPGGRRARIRGLQSHKQKVDRVSPGSRVAINLSGISTEEITRGCVVAMPGLLRPTTLVDLRFRHLPDAGRPLAHNAEVKFFSGAAESLGHVRLIGARELQPGEEGWLQVRLADALALDRGDRFILRYPSPPQTIGGGTVLDPHPPHRWRRFKGEVIGRMEMLAQGTPEELLMHALDENLMLPQGQIAALSGLDSAQVTAVVDRLAADGDILMLPGGWLITEATWNRIASQIAQELGAYHAQNPLRAGMPREELRSRLGLDARRFTVIAARAVETRVMVDEGAVVRLANHEVRFTPAQQQAVDELRRQLKANPFSPPSFKEAALIVGEEVLQVLIARGELVAVSTEVFFDANTYARLVEGVRAHLSRQGTITVAEARDLFQTSRKYALALLEHLDAIGVTRRSGDLRVLR